MPFTVNYQYKYVLVKVSLFLSGCNSANQIMVVPASSGTTIKLQGPCGANASGFIFPFGP